MCTLGDVFKKPSPHERACICLRSLLLRLTSEKVWLLVSLPSLSLTDLSSTAVNPDLFGGDCSFYSNCIQLMGSSARCEPLWGGKEGAGQAQGAAKLPLGDTGHCQGPAGPPSLEAFAPRVEGRGQRPL